MAKKKSAIENPGSGAEEKDYLADVPSRVISGTMGLMGFAMTAFVGIWAGNPAIVTLTRAMVACAFCAIVGRFVGIVAESCVREYIGQYQDQNQRPGLPKELIELEKTRAAHEQVVDEMRKKAA